MSAKRWMHDNYACQSTHGRNPMVHAGDACLDSYVKATDYDAALAVLRQCVVMLDEAHAALYSEYVDCPWCSGHIGYEYTRHTEDCTYVTTLSAARQLFEGEKV